MHIEELFTPLHEDSPPATMNKWAERGGEVMVNVDVDKFDKLWKETDSQGNFYVGPGGAGAGIKGRYPRFIEFMKTADSYEVPEVSVKSNGVIDFTNGRHRYAVMRDQGHRILPMSMDPGSVENAKKYGLIKGMTEQNIEEGVPDPKKLLRALKAFIELATERDLRTAFKKMEEMGLNPLQTKQVFNAYEKFDGARKRSAKVQTN